MRHIEVKSLKLDGNVSNPNQNGLIQLDTSDLQAEKN